MRPTISRALGGGSSVSANAWTAYTPGWTASGTAPAIGDGTLRGAYLLDGKVLRGRFELIVGTTTTFGTGEWRFGLPGAFLAKNGFAQTAPVSALDRGTAMWAGVAIIGDRDADYTDLYDKFVITNPGGSAAWGATVPMTWASRDRFACSYMLEID